MKLEIIRKNLIDVIVVIFFALYYILPSFSEKYSFMISIILGLGYIFYLTIKNEMRIPKIVCKYFLIIVFIALAYMILTDASSISQTVENRGMKRFISKFYQMFMMFFPLVLYKRCSSILSWNNKKHLLVVIYLLYAYVMFNTMKAIVINPNITRSWEEFAESSQGNVGNYYFVYSIPIFMALFAMFLMKITNFKTKLIIIVIIGMQINFLLLAQYTLSVIIGIIGIGYEVYISSGKGKKRLGVICIIISFILLLPVILKFAVEHVPSEQMAIRLNEVYNFIVGGDSSGYNMHSRLTLYTDSIRAFLSSPIIGNSKLEFDGHATFLTVLSDLGLVGAIPFYYLYYKSYKIVSCRDEQIKKYFKPIFCMLIMMGLTNPIHTALPLMFAVWFIAPLTISVYNEYTNIKNKLYMNKNIY